MRATVVATTMMRRRDDLCLVYPYCANVELCIVSWVLDDYVERYIVFLSISIYVSCFGGSPSGEAVKTGFI
jgi:hypothetical protein